MLVLLLQFSAFAFIASITPGPTNIVALNNGQRMGWRATVPFSIGAGGGAAVILLITSLGLAAWLTELPRVRTALAWGGVLWLSYLAWTLYHAAPVTSSAQVSAPLTHRWWTGTAMQIVNPKTWVMALTVSSLFPVTTTSPIQHAGLLAGLFFAIAVPCIGAWAWAGHKAGGLMSRPNQARRLNRLLAIALLVSVWWSLLGG